MPALELAAARELSAKLGKAAAAGDWEEVRRIDALLNAWANQLRLHPSRQTPQAESAVRDIVHAHANAVALCAAALRETKEQLAKLHTEHMALTAYAQHQEES